MNVGFIFINYDEVDFVFGFNSQKGKNCTSVYLKLPKND